MVPSDLQTIKDKIIYRKMKTMFHCCFLFQNIVTFYFQAEELRPGKKKGEREGKGKGGRPPKNNFL